MKVRAKARGVYQTLREAGDVFEVGDGETASWFEPVAQPMEAPLAPLDDDPLGIHDLTDTPPEEPLAEMPEEDNGKTRKNNKPA